MHLPLPRPRPLPLSRALSSSSSPSSSYSPSLASPSSSSSSSSSCPPLRERHRGSPLYCLQAGALSGLPRVSASPFLVLGIESSCDDTAAAVVRSDGKILSNVVASQHKLHENFGGVVPSLARQAHQDSIDAVVAEALAQANLGSADEIDGIAVTRGPGLEICLRVGLNKAQELARVYKKPLALVHHLEAHCLISRIAIEEEKGTTEEERTCDDDDDNNKEQGKNFLPHCRPKVDFPFLTLLASGGHTSLLLCRELGNYEVIGGTVDDALGEALDKSARLIGLSTGFSGGGAAIEAAARLCTGKVPEYARLTVPLLRQRNCDFSYSGLKNGFRMAVERVRKDLGQDSGAVLPPDVTADLAAGFQEAAFRHAEDRLYRAIGYIEDNREELNLDINSLVICGGVAANQELRRRLLRVLDNTNEMRDIDGSPRWRPFFPPPKLCTDNGVMVAWAGIEQFCKGYSSSVAESPAEAVQPLARWTLGPHVNRNNDVVFRKRVKHR